MNIVGLSNAIHNKINTATSTADVLILSKVIEKLQIGTVKTVATYVNLLDNYPKKGEVYFVEDEERLYYGLGNFWFLITDTASIIAYAWGSGTSGQLGDNTILDKSAPVVVVGGFTDWVEMSAGTVHGAGLRANGTLWAWGNNYNGRLGDNTTTSRSSPVSVVGGFTDWIKVSAGVVHTIGVRANGTIWAWGNNTNGELGDNTIVSKLSPVSVAGGFTDWTTADTANTHSLAIRATGILYAWGVGTSGQLGDNTIVNKSSPVLVAGGFTDWASASAGESHSLAIRANGTLYAWGLNTSGQLGDGTVVSKNSPVLVAGGAGVTWVSASAGGAHSLAIRTDGTAWAWGSNGSGRLGDNSLTTASKSSPVSVVGGFANWIQVSAAGNAFGAHSIGIRSTGQLYAWGSNLNGRLGDGTTVSKSSPVLIGGFADWVSVNAGANSFGLRSIK